MLTFVLSLVAVAGVLTLVFYKARPVLFFPVSFIWLALVSFLWTPVFVYSLAVLWGVAFVLTLLSPLRRRLITQPLMRWFHKQQPPLSHTEKEALYAGGSWYEKEFFTGKPNFAQLYSLPKSKLTQEEEAFLNNEVVTLCQMLNDWEINHEHKDLPEKVWRYIKEKKFWALVIDKKYGGHGFSAAAHSAVISKIASKSIATAINVMVPNSLGPAEFLHFYGTPDQKEKYLPRLASGEEVACFALTSNEAGSDASRISDSGVVCYGEFDGENVLGIRLNFQKRYITLAPICTLIGLAFQLSDPDKLLAPSEKLGITCALVPANLPGVKKGERHLPMGLHFMNGPVEGKDVFIPLDYVIGGRENCGKGWRMLMECLSMGRGISLPGLATAATQYSLRTTSAYAQLRWQFKRPISDFEGVGLPLGNLAGLSYLCEAARQFNALAVDQQAKPALASAIAKYHLTEIGRTAVNYAMDIHGGRAVQDGPRNYLSSLYQGIPICITVEGANILTRNLIIFGQGVIRCHPYLQKEIDASEKGDLTRFDSLFWNHLGFVLSNALRTFLAGLFTFSGKHFYDLAACERQVTRLSSALTFISDVALAVLGARLKVMEALSARLGDALSYLYLASAVMKFYKQSGSQKNDRAFLEWSIQYCLSEVQNALYSFLANFPKRSVGVLLKWMVFPWGRRLSTPSDTLTLKLKKSVIDSADVRDRLTRVCYAGTNAVEAAGRIESAYQAWLKIKPLWKKCEKIDKNINALSSEQVCECFMRWAQESQITSAEAQELKQFVMQRYDALQVDVFGSADISLPDAKNAEIAIK